MAFCSTVIMPAEYYEMGLVMPAPIYRRDSISSQVDENNKGSFSSSHSSLRKGSHSSSITVEDVIPPANIVPASIPQNAQDKVFTQISNGGQSITGNQVAQYARMLGLAPSVYDTQQLIDSKGNSFNQAKSKEVFGQYFYHKEDSVDYLMKVFTYFDVKSSGILSRNQLVNILTHYGEPLSQQEVASVLTQLGMTNDQIDYSEFCARLMAPSN